MCVYLNIYYGMPFRKLNLKDIDEILNILNERWIYWIKLEHLNCWVTFLRGGGHARVSPIRYCLACCCRPSTIVNAVNFFRRRMGRVSEVLWQAFSRVFIISSFVKITAMRLRVSCLLVSLLHFHLNHSNTCNNLFTIFTIYLLHTFHHFILLYHHVILLK